MTTTMCAFAITQKFKLLSVFICLFVILVFSMALMIVRLIYSDPLPTLVSVVSLEPKAVISVAWKTAAAIVKP